MIAVFDVTALRRIVNELRRAMRGLLIALCDELELDHSETVASLNLPVGFFRVLERALPSEAYANWNVVGWIEELNDIVYFLDVRRQLGREQRGQATSEFASAFLAECEGQFYEHHYLDELFPAGLPEPDRLPGRLTALCERLARHLTQESTTFVPGLPCVWVDRTHRPPWEVPCDLNGSFERAEPEGCLSVGLDGAHLVPPQTVRSALARQGLRATLVFSSRAVRLRVGRLGCAVPVTSGVMAEGWRVMPATWVRRPNPDGFGGLTVGPTLVHGAHGHPTRLTRTDREVIDRIARALAVLDRAWPIGAALLASLSARVVPLRAPGVVSYSYRHRPGLSFINCADRDDLDLLDDLIHENSHHHLNLLLRKYRLHRGDGNQEAWYSPWRRSLRPLRGILHATFTFTLGAVLFERLSRLRDARGRAGRRIRRETSVGLHAREALRARARGLEEVASVRYSLRDLRGTATRLGWLTPAGRTLVGELAQQVGRAARRLAPYRGQVESSRYGARLHRHLRALEDARRSYRLNRRLTA